MSEAAPDRSFYVSLLSGAAAGDDGDIHSLQSLID